MPASGSQAPSMAFAVRTSARLPLGPPLGGLELTTLVRPRNFTLATDRSVVPPRFAPGLSTTHGGVPTGDPDISPGQAFPGWLPQLSLIASCHLDTLLQPWRPSCWAHVPLFPTGRLPGIRRSCLAAFLSMPM